MKKVIHFKIPLDEDGYSILPHDLIHNFAEYVDSRIPDEYSVVFTPFTMQTLDANGNFIDVDIPKIEFKEFVRKYLNNSQV